MAEHKGFFRNVFDAMVESRSRQAERELAQYRELYKFTTETAAKR